MDRKDIRTLPKDSLQQTILRINDKKIRQEAFVEYIKNRSNLPVFELFKTFRDTQIEDYYKENLIYTVPEYAHVLKEYEDGLLLFELMQEKIWEAATKDSLGLKKYFKNNVANYKTDTFEMIKGQVINDYQNFLEKEWIAALRRQSEIIVNKRQLKRLIRFYREE